MAGRHRLANEWETLYVCVYIYIYIYILGVARGVAIISKVGGTFIFCAILYIVCDNFVIVVLTSIVQESNKTHARVHYVKSSRLD